MSVSIESRIETIIKRANREGIKLTRESFTIEHGAILIDSMPWFEWLEAMTMD